MKKLLIMAAMMLAGVCFSSCSKDNDGNSSTDSLTGVWLVQNHEGMLGGIAEFNADGTFRAYENYFEGGWQNALDNEGYLKINKSELELWFGTNSYKIQNGELYLGGEFRGTISIISKSEFNFYNRGEVDEMDKYIITKGFRE